MFKNNHNQIYPIVKYHLPKIGNDSRSIKPFSMKLEFGVVDPCNRIAADLFYDYDLGTLITENSTKSSWNSNEFVINGLSTKYV